MTEQIFNNRYHLDERLGEGGTAIVYRGADTLLRRPIAVKVLRPQFAADAEFVRRFYHEAESAAKLTHPNIVNIYDVGREADTYYIVMELVDGTTLARQIETGGPIDERRVIDYAIQVCRGLAYAHRQGLLHRDIKPANILVTHDGIVKISDFGIARAVERQTMVMTQSGNMIGSVHYLSPEQAQDHELTPASDLYSLGVVIYEMLVARPPFSADAPIAVALKHVNEEAPALPPSVSPELAAIVARLLRKNPEERYRNADELLTALRGARDSAAPAAASATVVMPSVAIPDPPPRPSPLPDHPVEKDAPRRSSRATILLVLLLLMLGVLAGVLIVDKPLVQIGRKPVVLPSELGRTSAEAQDALSSEGFTVRTTTAPSESVAEGKVVSQDPQPGTQVARGGVVTLTVSSGVPLVEVPDLSAFSEADARRLLAQSNLQVKTVERFDASAKGSVVSQRPAAHAKVHARAVVELVVSEGPAPAQVPSVTAMPLADARRAVEAKGLKLVVGQQTSSDSIAAGTIVSQDPSAGSSLAAGSTVTVIVSAGAAPAAVPDVTLSKVADAVATVQGAGFVPQVSYSLEPGPNTGNVIGENPQGGTRANRGTVVTLVVAVPGVVPDVTGMSLEAARAALQDAGYVVGNVAETQDGADGKVARTEPAGGSKLRPGESIVIYQNSLAPEPGPTEP